MKQIATFLIATALTTVIDMPKANADVNMMEASFRSTFTDLEMNGLKIQRRYDSRSNVSGVFGFGWCSTFDTHLAFEKLPDGKIQTTISDCGKITASNAPLKYVNGTYSQALPTGLTRRYNADTGDLMALRGPAGGAEVQILRTRSRLSRDAALGEGLKMRQRITDKTANRIRLVYDDLNETVTSLETSDGKRLEFTYSADRNLLSAKNAWNNTYRFDYDTLHNLTRAAYPDHTFEQMTYDSDRDRLLSFQGRDGCSETYSHQVSTSDSGRHQTSTAHLICQGKTKRDVRFDFNFINRSGHWLLSDMSLTRDGTTQKTNMLKGAQ
jgi:YD repeat-containing protein